MFPPQLGTGRPNFHNAKNGKIVRRKFPNGKGISDSSLESIVFFLVFLDFESLKFRLAADFVKTKSLDGQEYNNWDKHSWIPSWCLQSWAVKSSSRPVVFSSLWGPTFLLLGTGTPKWYMFLLLALTMTLMSIFQWYWNHWTFADLPYLEAQMFSSVLRSSAPTILEETFQRHTAAFQDLNHRLRLEIMAFLKRTLWHTLLWAPCFVCHIFLFKEMHHYLFTPNVSFVRTLQTLISNCCFEAHYGGSAQLWLVGAMVGLWPYGPRCLDALGRSLVGATWRRNSRWRRKHLLRSPGIGITPNETWQ